MQIYYYPVVQQQRVRSTVSPHTLLSITFTIAGLIKQKTLILLNNLFSSLAVQAEKAPNRKHFFNWMNYYISNLYLPIYQIQNTQITPTNTSHILLKYSPYYWAPTNILYTQAHKLPWALSQIWPIIAHISSNLGFQKNTHHTTTIIGPQNYIISTKIPSSFTLWAKPKNAQQYHLLSPLLHGTIY